MVIIEKNYKDFLMHFIIKCKNCGHIVSQCRCPGPKQTRYVDECAMCKVKEK